ncbi:MAG: hypothetical protein NT039_00205 [Candidatus Berkelbacteria bacterium]|nr:hypothetical protein [Candidatus Berkelbacteria bacterium]
MLMKTALLSVYEKKKPPITDFAQALLDRGIGLIASGGTADTIAKAGLPVTNLSDIVGEPILEHKVVTIDRATAARMLADENDPKELAEAEKHGGIIDIVCVDMYPLEEEIARPDSTRVSVIAQVDVGGRNLLNAAAKGGRVVICDPADRQRFIEWLDAGMPEPEAFKDELAAKAMYVVARYTMALARYLSGGKYEAMFGVKAQDLRYGENPHQGAAQYSTGTADPLALDRFVQVAGSGQSFVNATDGDRLLRTATRIAAGFGKNRGAVPLLGIGVKHGNACGAAYGDTPQEVIEKMVEGDPLAIFGGYVLLNFPLGPEEADKLLHHALREGQDRRLLDGIIAAGFDEGVVDLLKRSTDRCQMFENPALANLSLETLDLSQQWRQTRGGFLTEDAPAFVLNLKGEELWQSARAVAQQENDLVFAWGIGSTSDSNTITVVRGGQLLANAVGQQDRVAAATLSMWRAVRSQHDLTQGWTAYSDSFFPFLDAVEVLQGNGVTLIFASSGSLSDDEVRRYCAENGITLFMVPDKLGRGFDQH